MIQLSIGELAQRSGLSPKALRLYDESGLLPPAAVDPFTGYRSYTPSQVQRAQLIAALRGIGMGLARIRVVCDLPAADAAGEIRSWWRQEEADASSRAAAVTTLIRSLGHRPQETTTMTTTSFTTAIRTDQGHERPSQQDAAIDRPLTDGRRLIAVADGFGPSDELAPAVLSAFADALEATGSLEQAWTSAEALIGSDEAGSTLTAAVLEGSVVHVAHIGDTRAVLVRAGTIDPITHDHTQVRSLVAAGRLTAEEAAVHPDRATLNRALAAGAPTSPDLLTRQVAPGDLLVLLTDGIHAVVDPAELATAMTATTDPDALAAALVDLALAAGGPDNVAVAVARIS